MIAAISENRLIHDSAAQIHEEIRCLYKAMHVLTSLKYL